MATIRHHARFARSPDDVWNVVSDAAAISEWIPGIVTSTVEGNVRRCSLGPGPDLVEEIVTSDDMLRRFQYRITEGPMSLEFHLGTVDVLADPAGSLVIYSTEVSPDDAAGLFNASIKGGLAGLKAHLEG